MEEAGLARRDAERMKTILSVCVGSEGGGGGGGRNTWGGARGYVVSSEQAWSQPVRRKQGIS